MNKILVVPIIALLAVMMPNLAFAHTQAYDDGYKTGDTNAINNMAIDTNFFNSHSKNWQAGYNDGWNNAKSNIVSGNTQQSQSSDINIKGNNNHITVNQGQLSASSNDVPGNDGQGGSGNPSCIILCSIIR
jgi:hypothetical protein